MMPYTVLAMKAKYQINAGDLTVIRPMVSLMTKVDKNNLSITNDNCPTCLQGLL